MAKALSFWDISYQVKEAMLFLLGKKAGWGEGWVFFCVYVCVCLCEHGNVNLVII